MKNSSKLKDILNQQSGMAIIMVTSAVAILAVLLADFTFETKLNMIRVENQIDRYQAKLNAEAGMKFALAKLHIYQEAWNMLEKNSSAKSAISPSDAESVVTQPFFYPVPLPANANIIQRTAAEEFEKNSLVRGSMTVSMNAITGFLNPNTLKVIKNTEQERNDNNDQRSKTPQQFMEQTFIETIEREVKEKIENDEEFATKYSNLDPIQLVKELKFYINNPNDYDEPEKADVEKLYQNEDIQAKHASLESVSELYSLLGWDDDIVNLLKDKMSVHQVSVINVNEITNTQLKVLFPALTDLQIEEFFKYRDGDPTQGTDPQPFRTTDDFKQYITQKAGIVEASDYDKRMKEFSRSGIIIGVAGKLFKVTSKGGFGNSSYQLTAFIDLPIKPAPPKKKEDQKKGDPKREDTNGDGVIDDLDDEPEDSNGGKTDGKGDKNDQEKAKTLLLAPRILEIRTP